MQNLFVFGFSLFLVIRCAALASKYAGKIADALGLSSYVIGFIVVAVISILPETFISIHAALDGVSPFGLSTLFGSNVADLTLVFTVIIAVAGRSIKIESGILRKNGAYPFLLLLPIILGLDGFYSRLEGTALIVVGCAFYYLAFRNGGTGIPVVRKKGNGIYKSVLALFVFLALLLLGAHFTVKSATAIATAFSISPILIGMLVVGLGTTMPELFFSIESVRKRKDALAVGDIWGTVIADATVVVGILALISPFSFPKNIVYVTGLFMAGAAFLLMYFMRTGRMLTKKESYMLLAYWLAFVLAELIFSMV